MKQVIEKLTFDAFKRWCVPEYNDADSVDLAWQDLCAEAEKREPMIQYVALNKDGTIRFMSSDLEYLARHYSEYKVIRLVEEQGK